METLLLAGKEFIFIFSVIGIIFHSLILKNAEIGKKIEQKMIREFGIKKKVIYWLEKNRMTLHERLFSNRMYHIAAIICLLFVVLQTIRMDTSTLLEKTHNSFLPEAELPFKEIPLPR